MMLFGWKTPKVLGLCILGLVFIITLSAAWRHNHYQRHSLEVITAVPPVTHGTLPDITGDARFSEGRYSDTKIPQGGYIPWKAPQVVSGYDLPYCTSLHDE